MATALSSTSVEPIGHLHAAVRDVEEDDLDDEKTDLEHFNDVYETYHSNSEVDTPCESEYHSEVASEYGGYDTGGEDSFLGVNEGDLGAHPPPLSPGGAGVGQSLYVVSYYMSL